MEYVGALWPTIKTPNAVPGQYSPFNLFPNCVYRSLEQSRAGKAACKESKIPSLMFIAYIYIPFTP